MSPSANAWPARPARTAAMLIASVVLFSACDRDAAPTTITRFEPANSVAPQFPCTAQYTVITADADSLMTGFGAGIVVDTTDVCQSWNGTDYSIRVTEIGSSERQDVVGSDSVVGGEWHEGVARALDANGNDITAPNVAGGTIFDALEADASTRAAVADDPYFELASLGDCVADNGEFADCSPDVCQPQIECFPSGGSLTALSTSLPTSGQARAAIQADDEKFKKHKVKRHGVRAVLEEFDEVPSDHPNQRRFRKVTAAGEERIVVDKRSQLMLMHEVDDKEGKLRVSHHWRRVRGGFVKSATREEFEEQRPSGRRLRSAALTTFVNVRINGQYVSAP